MNTSKLFPALLTCAVALCAHPAHAAKLDYDGLSAEEALSLGLNDSDRDTNDAGVIDGLEFDKTAILSVNIRNPFPSSGESKRPSITFDGKQAFYRQHLFSRALIHTRLIFQAAAAYKVAGAVIPRMSEDLAMATGWAGDGAVQDQIDATIKDAVERARRGLHQGKSLLNCESCGECIPTARRKVVPGVRFCVRCQEAQDREVAGAASLYNRRGSKDSQLR